jgi:hypothetical protein
MNKDEIFAAWAPDASIWSQWTKPVLFAHLDVEGTASDQTASPGDLNWCPAVENKVAIVVDLAGAESVWLGIALAERGYRPVPLFNAIPLPGGHPVLDPFTGRKVAAVDVLPTLGALRPGAERLARLPIAAAAPPAFLLDHHRQGDGRAMLPDEFDNRSVCFTTDFPSANFLLAHGIQGALLVQKARSDLSADLTHVLRSWQQGNVSLKFVRVDSPAPPVRLEIPKPPWYGTMFQRAFMAFGLHRARGGGFGAWMPGSSAGG